MHPLLDVTGYGTQPLHHIGKGHGSVSGQRLKRQVAGGLAGVTEAGAGSSPVGGGRILVVNAGSSSLKLRVLREDGSAATGFADEGTFEDLDGDYAFRPERRTVRVCTAGEDVQEHYANMGRIELDAFGRAITDWVANTAAAE